MLDFELDGGVVETVGGSSGSGGAFSASAEGVGAAGSSKFNCLLEAVAGGLLPLFAVPFVSGAEARPVTGELESSGAAEVCLFLSFFDLCGVAVVAVVLVGAPTCVAPGVIALVLLAPGFGVEGLMLPFETSWASPAGAGGGVTAVATGAGVAMSGSELGSSV